jgi:glycosyltransferase involved in cell wall biosynthesis
MISEHASPLAALGGVDAGGQNLHVAELAGALARAGEDVVVYTRRDCPDLPTRVEAPAGFSVVHVPAGPAVPIGKDHLLPFMRPFGRWMARDWRRQHWVPDVVHAHFWMSGVAASAAVADRPIATVITYHALGTVKRRHQADADTSPPERIAIERRLGRRMDQVIAQCPDEVDELTAMGVPPGRISVVPSGVDVLRFSPVGHAAPRRPGLTRVLTAGRLVARKGYADLIDAVARVPGTELVIAGGAPDGIDGDPEAGRLRELADRAGVADRVVLTGAVERAVMPDLYRSSDVVACTPWYEPFGLTPLEAMACGVPVIVYAVGGLQDSVVHGRTGLHVPPGDVAGLAGALQRVLVDPVLRRRLGDAGIHRTRTRYTWSATADQVTAVYAHAIAEPAPVERVAS